MSLTEERIREIGARLREMYECGRDDYIYVPVALSDDEYAVDLGEFGDREIKVKLEDSQFELDAGTVLDKYPVKTEEFEAFADELDPQDDDLELGTTPKVTLDLALDELERNGEGPLANAILDLVETFRQAATRTIDLLSLSVGPLPETPLPWPGALRPEIDYTAFDFPLRYQPPPGYAWTLKNRYVRVEPEKAEQYGLEYLRKQRDEKVGTMRLDSNGCVAWVKTDGDTLESGSGRWALWFLERDGIPVGTGDMGEKSLPLPIDKNGDTLGTWIGESRALFNQPWSSDNLEQGKRRVAEIRAEYEQNVLPKNEWGVTYDPFSVRYTEIIRAIDEDLRVGDLITGYGTVLRVEDNETTGGFRITYATSSSAERRVEARGTYNWSIKPMAGRELQPTALSISRAEKSLGAPQQLDYDPLTVDLKDEKIYVRTADLRRGDDIIGSEFGRVLTVSSELLITMDRNGERNTYESDDEMEWAVQPIDVDDRDAIPAAITLPDELPVEILPMSYDPLTVEVEEVPVTVRKDDLRLGDDVTGESFGRVVGVERMSDGAFDFTLNRGGVTRTYKSTPSGTWQVKRIVGVDRNSIPTAISLATQPVEAQF